MNGMGVLLDLMRGWLALLSIGATLLWLLYPRAPNVESQEPVHELNLVDEEADAGRVLFGAASSASRGRSTGVDLSDGRGSVLPRPIVWYPEQLDLHTGQAIHAGAGSGSGT